MATWILSEEGNPYTRVEAATAQEALDMARANVDCSVYTDPDTGEAPTGTIWIKFGAYCRETDEEISGTVVCDPAEPECTREDGHEWDRPGEDTISGPGILIREVCEHCGTKRTRDTWARDPDTNVEGLHSVRYSDAEAE